LDPDVYRVIASPGEAETKVKGSRFLGLALPAATAEKAEENLESLRKKHHDATHVCFAWRVGHGASEKRRAADAGEPAGTAGTPILQAMERAGVSDGLVAVIRWFGGTKLGTGGLARAYGECARLALENARIAEKTLRRTLIATFEYPLTGGVLRLAERFGAITEGPEYGETVQLRLAVPASRLEPFRDALVEAAAGKIHIETPAGP